MLNEYYPYQNTPLPYAYDALEPYIDAKTMQLHHDNHLGTYIDRLNAALRDHPQLHALSLEQLVTFADRLPRSLRDPVKNNAGGVYNHRLYFESLTPQGGGRPTGALLTVINRQFGGFDQLMKDMTELGLALFGSGYVWLVCNRSGGLQILSTANQDTPLPYGFVPVLNLDVWEHAYDLKHYNKRAGYIADWAEVINWQIAGERYAQCTGRG